jgi:hypothetical protein
MNKWQAWYDSLPKHTQEYLSKQPLYHESDLMRVAVVCFALGFAFSFLF